VHEVEGFGLTQMNVIPEGEMRHICANSLFWTTRFSQTGNLSPQTVNLGISCLF
jgi:hypothetical protein